MNNKDCIKLLKEHKDDLVKAAQCDEPWYYSDGDTVPFGLEPTEMLAIDHATNILERIQERAKAQLDRIIERLEEITEEP
jgi:hypothetical protein